MRSAARAVAKEIADHLEDVGASSRAYRHPTRQSLEKWLMLLAPPRKRKVRSPGVKARRATTRELDELCREVVFLRDHYKCRKCGQAAGLLDWAHVYSRRFKVCRWAITNSMVLCRKHHMWWHHSPTEAIEWWKSEVGPEAMRRLELMKRAAKAAKPELTKAYLLQEKKRLEGSLVAEKA